MEAVPIYLILSSQEDINFNPSPPSPYRQMSPCRTVQLWEYPTIPTRNRLYLCFDVHSALTRRFTSQLLCWEPVTQYSCELDSVIQCPGRVLTEGEDDRTPTGLAPAPALAPVPLWF